MVTVLEMTDGLCIILDHIFKSHDNFKSKELFHCVNHFQRLRFGHLNIAIENKQNKKLVMMAHACEPSCSGTEAAGSWI